MKLVNPDIDSTAVCIDKMLFLKTLMNQGENVCSLLKQEAEAWIDI